MSNLTLSYGHKGSEKTAKANAADGTGVLSVHAHTGNAFKCEAKKELALGDDVKATIVQLRVSDG